MDEPIGVYTEMKEDDVGLYVRDGCFIDDDPRKTRITHMKAGSLTGLSVHWVRPERLGIRPSKEAFLLKETDLWEVSLVTFRLTTRRGSATSRTRLARGEIPEQKNRKESCVMSDSPVPESQSIHGRGYGALSLRDAEDVGSALNALKNLNF